MARTITPVDACAFVTLVHKELAGIDASIQEVDTSNFASVGETIMSYGTENVFNAIGAVAFRTQIMVRPYSAKFGLINEVDGNLFKQRLRRISYYSKLPQNAGNFNTDLFTNLKDGFDNGENTSSGTPQSTKSQWVQNAADPLELNFAGSSVWQDSITVYDEALHIAFQGPEEFAKFINGFMTEKANDIESQKEAFNQASLLNYMAGLFDLDAGSAIPGGAINLTAAFNAEYGTSYTSAELLSDYLDEFLPFMVETIKNVSDRLELKSSLYHWTPDPAKYLERFTPKKNQKIFLYKPLITKAKANVLPAIFNDQYLSLDNYEGVMAWQNLNDPMAIDVTPAIPDTTDPSEQTTGDEVKLSYVVGVIFDDEACKTHFQLDAVDTTAKEARKHYRNIWYSMARNILNDFTFNGVLLYMADPAPEPEPGE